MNLDRFIAERQASWNALDETVRRAKFKAERLGPDGVRRLATLYRSTVADLAYARRRFPWDPVTRRLEELVLRSRQVVYGGEASRGGFWFFVHTGYWRRVAERPGALLLSVLLLFGPMALAAVWALDDPAAAIGIVPEQFRGAADPGSGVRVEPTLGDQAAMAGEILTNNIQVSILAFAGGLLLGLGTCAALIFNGGFIGAIMGLAIGNGGSGELFRLIVPHGVLELSIICIAGCAGLRVGWSIVDPGVLKRSESLRREARRAVELILGTMPWFVLAGFVEGFVTGDTDLAGAILVGTALGALYWGLVLWRGVLSRRARALRAAA